MRPSSYLALFLGLSLPAMALAYAGTRTWAMDAPCDASGYSDDRYLAYCQNDAFGDYEHAAYYRRLEPDAVAGARRAEVLFLGNSRMQFAFSRAATDAFFAARRAPYHLLGFGYGEMAPFPFRLMRDLALRPRALVVNVDPFFEARLSPAAGPAMKLSWKTWVDFALKSASQPLHRLVCGREPSPCPGGSASVFRSRATGQWSTADPRAAAAGTPFGAPPPLADEVVRSDAALAAELLGSTGVRPGCVILTQVPEPFSDDAALALAVARDTGAIAVLPRLSGLATFDGSHLDRASGDRWAESFFREAAPALDRCLAAPTGPAS